MGWFTAYDQNGRMVSDFDKSDYDFLCRYGRMPEEVLDENAKLRELCWRMRTYMTGVVEHNGYQIMTTGYTMLGSRLEECEEAMRELGIDVDS